MHLVRGNVSVRREAHPRPPERQVEEAGEAEITCARGAVQQVRQLGDTRDGDQIEEQLQLRGMPFGLGRRKGGQGAGRRVLARHTREISRTHPYFNAHDPVLTARDK